MSTKIRSVFAALATAFVAVAAYVFIHESGHAIVAAFCGAQITKLSILEAHTWWRGGNFTAATLSLCHAAGALLPVCVSIVGLCFYRKDIKSPIYHLGYFYLTIISAASLSVWVLFPVMSMFTALPDTDDVTKFLQSSGLPSIAVSLVSAALILPVLFLAKKKGMFQRLASMMKNIMNAESDSPYLPKKVIWKLSAAILAVILATVLLELPDLMTKPIVSLSSGDETALSDLQFLKVNQGFEVQRAKDYQLDIQLDAAGFLTDIRILDSNQTVLYQNIAEKISSGGSIYLDEGTYAISIVCLRDTDEFERHCREMGYIFEETTAEELKSAYKNEVQAPKLSLTIK